VEKQKKQLNNYQYKNSDMKKSIYLLGLLLILSISVLAQNQTVKFKVYGNCGMCEKRIEKAAIAVEGVSKAEWNKESQMLNLTFDKTKTNLKKIKTAIANAGHDTETIKADDKVYNALPGCCKYKREKIKKQDNHNSHKH